MSEFLIETKQLTKIYGEQTAVNSVNLHVKKGRICVDISSLRASRGTVPIYMIY